MCGIFGYLGSKRDATQAVFEGLKRLDYRGYDSWGVAIVKDTAILVDKHVGIVRDKLLKLPQSQVAIGHTRWATNGAVTKTNAHPHFSSDKSFILAHNGIAENYVPIKEKLAREGYRFVSQTDTEVIVRLIEEKRKKTKSLPEATRLAFKELTGRNTIIILTAQGEIIASRNGSPLVVGLKEGFDEIYLSSDTLSFAPYVDRIIVLNNGEMVTVGQKQINVFDIANAQPRAYTAEKNYIEGSSVDKEGYKHFMLKEIHEEPFVIKRVKEQSDEPYLRLGRAIHESRYVYCIGSGTAGAAAAQMAYYLRVYSGINAVGLIGAEAKDYFDLMNKNDLLIAPSQSGETADVLEVIEEAKKHGTKIASFVNMPGSMMTRLSDFKFMAQAGGEICVMSTKIFVSQLSWGYLVAKATANRIVEGKKNLDDVSCQIEKLLHNKGWITQIKQLAKYLSGKHHIFLLSKGQNLQIIKEGMVKIIEGSYIHAHAIPAGDLKHYAITMMERGVAVIFVTSQDNVKTDVLNSLGEVKARGAEIIAIGAQAEKDFDRYIEVPDMGQVSAIINIIPLQLLAYYMADTLGHNVDKPRHIAKSVTVK